MFFCKTNKGDGEVFQMLGKVGNVRVKTSMKKHLFEGSFIFFFKWAGKIYCQTLMNKTIGMNQTFV